MEHTDAVRDVLDHGQVVGNEQVGRAGLLLNVFHQVDHLGLDGHVQCRDALIGNDELGVHDEGTGDAHTLALAARELMGVALGVLRGQTDLGQNGLDLGAALLLILIHVVDVQSLADDVLHLFAGVQGGHGVLEDHLHLSAQGAVLAVVQLAADILPVKGDLACGGVVQPDDAAADGGLARAGLAHQTVRFTGINFKADIVHSLDGKVFVYLEILLQALDFQQRGSTLSCHVTPPPRSFLLPLSCGQCAGPAPAACPPWERGGPAARWPHSGYR